MSVRAAFKSLREHRFFSLSAGIAASNLMTFLAMPVLTRLYSAQSFGTFAVFYAVTVILGTFSTLRLDQALPIINETEERRDVSRVALMAALALCALFFLICFFTPAQKWVHVPLEPSFPLAISSAAFLLAIMNIETTVAIKGGNLKTLSCRYFGEKLVTLSASFALYKLPIYGLIIAQLCGYTTSVLILTVGTHAFLFRKFSFSVDTGRMGALIRKYRDFPIHNGTSTLFQIFQMQIPAVLFSMFYPLQSLGFYNLAQRIMDAPNTLVGTSLGTVFYRRLLSADPKQHYRIYRRTMIWTAAAIVLPALVLAMFAGPIITWMFGAGWRPSATFLVLLLPVALCRMLYLVGQNCFIILRRLELGLRVWGFTLMASLIGIGAGYIFFDQMEWSVGLASCASACVILFGLLLIGKQLRQIES